MIVVLAIVADVIAIGFGWWVIANYRQHKRAAAEYRRGLNEALVNAGLAEEEPDPDARPAGLPPIPLDVDVPPSVGVSAEAADEDAESWAGDFASSLATQFAQAVSAELQPAPEPDLPLEPEPDPRPQSDAPSQFEQAALAADPDIWSAVTADDADAPWWSEPIALTQEAPAEIDAPEIAPAVLDALDDDEDDAAAHAAEPVEPEPVDPEPVDPEPVDPEPVDPEPVDPEPVVVVNGAPMRADALSARIAAVRDTPGAWVAQQLFDEAPSPRPALSPRFGAPREELPAPAPV